MIVPTLLKAILKGFFQLDLNFKKFAVLNSSENKQNLMRMALKYLFFPKNYKKSQSGRGLCVALICSPHLQILIYL